jgi:hypothetical protein
MRSWQGRHKFHHIRRRCAQREHTAKCPDPHLAMNKGASAAMFTPMNASWARGRAASMSQPKAAPGVHTPQVTAGTLHQQNTKPRYISEDTAPQKT